ncbi:hypothetical protein HanXRQr2_Chr09g0408101 [Helianthus annuus]|uniref:Uncharacterized protein n=1 Tax=Helianthus annuus TaxID=4232 RepID=A0A9K3IA05_HELAN|nr:hypothetical protein HanXRQr2_Chr09g0408101 [Helianthus annuus]
MNVELNVKGNNGEDNNNNKVEGGALIATLSSCISEKILNRGTTINSRYKTKAGRGVAIDPQSKGKCG